MFGYSLASIFLCLLLPSPGSLASESDEKLIDLSHPFNEKTLQFRLVASPFRLDIVHNETITKAMGGDRNKTVEYWYQTERYAGPTHAGTHLDAPCHFARGKWTVEDIPIQRLITRAVVVDIQVKADNMREAVLSISDLDMWERRHGQIPDGSVLLVRTGWDKHWPNRAAVFGTDSNDTTQYTFPGIEPEAADWLVKNRKVYGVGIDTPSLDHGQSQTYETHRILMNENIYGLENLANLGKLPETGITLYVLPMKISGASGAPCRVVASLDSNSGIGSTPAFLVTLACLVTVIAAYRATLFQ